jgi:hypothetical protein
MGAGLEWISTHQCTNCGWARWGHFLDGRKSHPPCPIFFFFFPTSSLPQNFPPSYLPPTSPRPTYHLPPPSYLPPTTPTPPSLHRQSSRDLGRLWSGSWSCGYGAGAAGVGAELLELERDPRAHEKVRSLACLLAATQQAPEPGSGACVTFCNAASSGAWELAAATQQTPELAATKPCNAASSGASLAVEEKEEPWTFCPILYIFYFALV